MCRGPVIRQPRPTQVDRAAVAAAQDPELEIDYCAEPVCADAAELRERATMRTQIWIVL